jgi:drug/metabolite transporter (DMT)-like permease
MHALSSSSSSSSSAMAAWPVAAGRRLKMSPPMRPPTPPARPRVVATRASAGGSGPGPARAAPQATRAAVATPPPPPQAEEKEAAAEEPSSPPVALAAAPAAAAAAAAAAAPDAAPDHPSSPWDALVAKVTSRRFRAFAMLNAMTLLLGSNWMVLKMASDAGNASDSSLDPSTFTAFRFLLAALVFSPSLAAGLADRKVVRASVELGAWCALGYATQSAALSMTPASRASLLSTFTVLIVPVFAQAAGQRIRPLVWGCAGAAVVGTLLLEAGSAEPPNVGDAWAILSAAAFAGQLFRTEVLTSDLPPQSSLPLMAVSMLVIAGATSAVAGVLDWRDAASTADALGNMAGGVADVLAAGRPLGAPHAAGLLAAGELAFTAFLSTALALLLEVVALRDVSSTEAALVYSMEPLIGASLSCLFLGERFGPTGVAGAAIILASSVATQVLGSRPAKEEEEEEPQAAAAAAATAPHRDGGGGGSGRDGASSAR